MPFKIKQLFVLVPDYPFGKGEPFIHGELLYLAKEIPHIYVFTRHEFAEDEERNHDKSLPDNIKIIPIRKRLTFADKVLGSIKGWLFHGKDLFHDLTTNGLFFNFLAWKTTTMYLIQAYTMDQGIRREMKKNQLKDEGGVWYSYWTDEAAFLLAKWRKSNKILRGVARAHGADLYGERHPLGFLPFRHFIYEHIDSIITISTHGRKHLIINNLKYAQKFKLSRLGIPTQNHTNQTKLKPIKIVSLSIISPIKNLECLVDALYLWDGEPMEWHHIGAGRLDSYEQEFIKKLDTKLKNHPKVSVHLHGWISPSGVINKLREINPVVLVNTSLYEGIPVSMMEAMSLGIPIIAPNVCGIPELLEDGYNGWLLHQTTPKELIEKLQSILSLNAHEYLQFSEAARKKQYLLFNEDINYERFKHLLEGSDDLITQYSGVLLSEIPDFKPLSGVAILNIGIGNVGAIEKMLKKSGIQADVVNFAEDIHLFHTIILPGVGAFDLAMQKLRQKNLIEVLQQHVNRGNQLIGICLGMQLLFERSEEGREAGLGFIKGTVKRFPSSIEKQGFTIPHMGWNQAEKTMPKDEEPSTEEGEFYFTHSYYCDPEDSKDVLFTSFHGMAFCSAVKSGNVWGFQFHPEKSLHHGKNLFKKVLVTSKISQ